MDENGAPFGSAVQLTFGDRDDCLPDISGDWIVYISYDDVYSSSGSIWAYQISKYTHHELTTKPVIHEAKIAGRLVTWREGPWSSSMVMMYDLAWLDTGFDSVVIAGPDPPTFDVETGDRFIVWAELVGDQYDVAAYDLDNLLRTEIATEVGVEERKPQTSGPWIVWQARESGSLTTWIKAKNMDTGEVRVIADNMRGNFRPSIDGDLITYESASIGPDTDLELYLYQLSTMETFQVTSNPYDQYLNNVFGHRVTYVDRRYGNEEIFVSTLEIVFEGDISVSPLYYDFGEVELGALSTATVTISNIADSDALTIQNIDFTSNSNPDFAITSAPFLPALIPPGGTIDIEVAYAPSTLGHAFATLEITSDDLDEPVVAVELTGHQLRATSNRLVYPVILDGLKSSPLEWADAIPYEVGLDLVWNWPDRRVERSDKVLRAAFKNDVDWLYMYYQIEWPADERDDLDGGFIELFFDPPSADDFSFAGVDGRTVDLYGWTGGEWFLDTEGGGQNNVEGAASYDGWYYRFEFRKMLDSEDGVDWSLDPGGLVGSPNAPTEEPHLMVGIWDSYNPIVNAPSTYEQYIFHQLSHASDIEVVPLSYNFGEVELGTSSTTIVTISNIGGYTLTVNDLTFSSDSNPDFSITYVPPLPVLISPGGTIDIEITYTPSAFGVSSAFLEIASDDTDEPLVMVSFSGTGVEYEPPPSEQIADILEFFDQSVKAGTLEGDGPGASAGGRLNALRNMIETAGDLISEGRIDEACEQLWDVYRRTDGNPRPPDFVTGEAASELASQILALLESLDYSP